jgi:hypothetical protein
MRVVSSRKADLVGIKDTGGPPGTLALQFAPSSPLHFALIPSQSQHPFPFPFLRPFGEPLPSHFPTPFTLTLHKMSSASYRFESFRPWKLPQDKGQHLRDRLSVSRYLSPVSLSATPSPSNLSNPVSQGEDIYAPRPELYPLPVRPPAQVCFNGGPQPNA